MPPHYLRHFIRGDLRIPDIVGVNKNDRPFVMASGASVTQNDRLRKPEALDFFPESV
ncbi:hypothetical protein BH24ACT20_BH24ACT20_16290 [soil metagenome]|jgi:hypothetical protein